jgi:hypothetical protein
VPSHILPGFWRPVTQLLYAHSVCILCWKASLEYMRLLMNSLIAMECSLSLASSLVRKFTYNEPRIGDTKASGTYFLLSISKGCWEHVWRAGPCFDYSSSSLLHLIPIYPRSMLGYPLNTYFSSYCLCYGRSGLPTSWIKLKCESHRHRYSKCYNDSFGGSRDRSY